MSETGKEDFRKIVEALENNGSDVEIWNLADMAACNFDTDVDDEGHDIVFYFEKYGREELWERMVAGWEADAYAAAMEDYDMALKPYCN